MEKVSADQKLKLIQSIRTENQYNRMKCREREKLLYGAEAVHMDGYGGVGSSYGSMDGISPPSSDDPHPSTGKGLLSRFRFRFFLAVCLSAAFIYMDKQQILVLGEPLRSYCEKLTEEDAIFDRILQSLNLFDF